MSGLRRRLVLASTSPYRRALLERLRLPFEVARPRFEEVALPGRPAREEIERFAREKARSLAADLPDALVVGSDQGLVVGGRLVGKPGTPEGARRQLREQRGGTHELVTAIAVLDAATGELAEATDVHRLTFRRLTDAAIERYVELDQPLDCAGSFRIEALGIALFERVEGEDPSAIEGMGLVRLVDLLARFGVSPLDPGIAG